MLALLEKLLRRSDSPSLNSRLRQVNDFRSKAESKAATGSGIKQILVADLRVGMRVTRLDRPWLETPFAMQGFHIKSEAEIDEIAKHCRHVYVDAIDGNDRPPPEVQLLDRRRPADSTKRSGFIVSDWSRETKIFRRSRNLTHTILEEIRMAGTINNKSAQAVVGNCIDSVLRDPSAMSWLSRMSSASDAMEGHALSCCVMAIGFGRHLNFTRDRMEKLGISALLHDIGFLKIPRPLVHSVYHSPTLEIEDLKLIKSHTEKGRDALAASGCYWGAVDVAYSHHENYDGSGYPRGIKGTEIPLFASIVSIVDAYDSLTSSSSYKSPVSSVDAIRIIYDQRGRQFDPALVTSFIRFIGLYPLGSIVQLRTGEVGVVISENRYYKHLPKVLLVMDGNGCELSPRVVDLRAQYQEAKQQRLFIRKAFPPGSFGLDAQQLVKESLGLGTDQAGVQ